MLRGQGIGLLRGLVQRRSEGVDVVAADLSQKLTVVSGACRGRESSQAG